MPGGNARAWRIQPATPPAAIAHRPQPNRSSLAPQLPPPAPTVDNWLASCRSPHTAASYARTVGQYAHEVRQIVEAGRAAHIDAMWAKQYVDHLRQRPGPHGHRLSAATINAIVGALSSYWGWMQSEGLVTGNPWQRRYAKLPERTGQRYLTREEVRRLLLAVPEGVQRTLVLTLYHTGARISELCQDTVLERVNGRPTGLHWRDITPRKDGAAVLTLCGKGGKTRLVPISRATVQQIRTITRRHPPDDFVFCHDRYDDPITRKDGWKIVSRAARLAGLKGNVSPHWLRHSYAVHMLEQGVPVNLVQALLGHARLDTTGIYARIVTAQGSTAYLEEL